MKYYLKLLSIPLLFLVLYISLSLVWVVFDLPSAEKLTEIVKTWFSVYGLPVLFISSIIESMLLVGSYFPGVFVIFISVILADSIPEAILAITIATIGLIIGHMGSYLLGKYGWYKLFIRFGMKSAVEKAQERLLKKGPIAILGSYWLPSIGALTDTAAGIMQMPFRIFITYSIISAVFWDSLVGTIVYILGDKALSATSPGTTGDIILYSLIAIWIIVLLIIDFFEKRKLLKNDVVVVNKKDEVIGTMPREESHRNGTPHRIAVIYVENSKGEILIQVRASNGKLDHSCSGHVDPGESYLDAAKRELDEELGIKNIELKLIGEGKSDNRNVEKGLHVVHVFEVFVCKTENFVPNPDEVKDAYWANPHEILKEMLSNPTDLKFSGGFRPSLPIYLKKNNT